MVECDLAKVEVAGSNPVSRSSHYVALASGEGFSYGAPPRGAVPKWLRGRSAKPLFVGSTPTRTSKFAVSSEPPAVGCPFRVGRPKCHAMHFNILLLRNCHPERSESAQPSNVVEGSAVCLRGNGPPIVVLLFAKLSANLAVI